MLLFDIWVTAYPFYAHPKLTHVLPQDGIAPRQPSYKHSRVLPNNSATIWGPRGTYGEEENSNLSWIICFY